MKNLFLLLLIVPLVFISCSKDDDDKNTLDGTVWVYSGEENGIKVHERIITFHRNELSFEGFELNGNRRDEFSGSGTYTYEPPLVIMVLKGETTEAIISGNEMAIQGGGYFVFIKK